MGPAVGLGDFEVRLRLAAGAGADVVAGEVVVSMGGLGEREGEIGIVVGEAPVSATGNDSITTALLLAGMQLSAWSGIQR